jgi:ABC-type amino acid transport substrate-binding protein
VVNNPSVKISTLDGAIDDVIAKTDYPRSIYVTLPQSSVSDQGLLDVTSKKADVTFAQPDVISLFLKTNPGTLRKISPQPLRLYGNSYAVKAGEDELYQMLNVAVKEAADNGTVDKILTKYQSSSDAYLRLAAPYAK